MFTFYMTLLGKYIVIQVKRFIFYTETEENAKEIVEGNSLTILVNFLNFRQENKLYVKLSFEIHPLKNHSFIALWVIFKNQFSADKFSKLLLFFCHESLVHSIFNN